MYMSCYWGSGEGSQQKDNCSDHTYTQDLNQIYLRTLDQNLILITVPVLKEDRIQLVHLVRLRSRE